MNKLPKPNFGIRFLSFLLCLLLFGSMLSGIIIADLRIITTKDNTSKIIRESLFTTYTARPALHHTATGNGHGVMRTTQTRYAMPKLDDFQQIEDTGIMTDVLVEFFYESMTEQYGELPVTLEDVEQFIEESTLQDEIADISASLISDMITGENTTVIDAERITNIVMDNAELIEEYFEVEMDEEAVSQMAEAITDNEVIAQIQEQGIAKVLMDSLSGNSNMAPEDENTPNSDGNNNVGIPGGDTMSDISTLAQTLETIRTALSASTMYACFGAALVWVVLLVLLNRKWIWYALRRIGVTLIFSSLPMLIPTILVMNTNGVVYAMLSVIPMVGPAVTLIATMTAPVCIGVAAAGLACIIAAIVLKVLAKKRLANPAPAIVTADETSPAEVAAAEVPFDEGCTEAAPFDEIPEEKVTLE